MRSAAVSSAAAVCACIGIIALPGGHAAANEPFDTKLALIQPESSSSALLLHRHPSQIDGDVLSSAEARELAARVTGGMEVEHASGKALPSSDVFDRPEVMLSVFVEGEHTSVDADKLGSNVLGEFSVKERNPEKSFPLSEGLELTVSVASHRAALDAQSSTSFSISASASSRHAATACNGHAAIFGNAGASGSGHRCAGFTPRSAVIQDVRGSDEDMLSRLAAAVSGASVMKDGLRLAGGKLEVGIMSARAEGRAFLEELDMLSSLLPEFLAPDVCRKDSEYATPISVASTLSTVLPLSRAEGWDAATTSAVSAAATKAVIDGWSEACAGKSENEVPGVLAMVVTGVPVVPEQAEATDENVESNVQAATARRLLAADDAPALSAGKGNATVYTMHDIATYQIKLGSGLFLAFALLLSVCLFCGSTMQYTDDNLLFGRLAIKQDNKNM